jgi:hypothetical protein
VPRSRFDDPFRPDQEIRLSLAGMASVPGSRNDLELLARFVRWVAELERGHDPEDTGAPLTVTSDQAARQLLDDDPDGEAAGRLAGMIDLLPPFWIARSGSEDRRHWELKVGRAVRAFRDTRDGDDLLARVDASGPGPDAWLSPPAFPRPRVIDQDAGTDSGFHRGGSTDASDRSAGMIRPEAVDEFRELLRTPKPATSVVGGLRTADEKSQLEPALMRIIGEVDETPHGPTEIADLTTVHLRVFGRPAFTGIVIKGRARKTVRAADVADQLQRAAALPSIGLVVLAAVGDIQDDAKHRLAWLADKAGADWLVLDRSDLAHLFVAYGELCPSDGSWTTNGVCAVCGWTRDAASARLPAEPTILSLEDSSHGNARRYGVHLLVPAGQTRADVVEMIRAALPTLRAQDYSRSELVEARHAGRLADVLFMFVYDDIRDRPGANWICRAQWISPALDRRSRPTTWGEPDPLDPALTIDWSTTHDAIAAIMSNPLPKARYVRMIDVYVERATELAAAARRVLEDQSRGDEPLLRLSSDVEQLDGPDRDRPAPFECADLDVAFEALSADLFNVALPFSELGRSTWPELATRRALARQALDQFDRDLVRIRFEREKVR